MTRSKQRITSLTIRSAFGQKPESWPVSRASRAGVARHNPKHRPRLKILSQFINSSFPLQPVIPERIFRKVQMQQNVFLIAENRLLNDTLLLFAFLAPFVLVAIAFHLFEQLIQRRMAKRFGWKSILFTGWLGTPIHELSHAVMCYTFRHKIDEMALFKPDVKSGRLGYVRHSFQKGNWFQEFGNLFIGIAPLIGGTIALTLLLLMFFPDFAMALFSGTAGNSDTSSWFGQLTQPIRETFLQIFTFENIKTFRFWIFVYLVLCVASHMAPSRSDYLGAGKPMIISAIFLGLIFVAISLLGFGESTTQFLSQLSRPIVGMFSLSIGLCAIAGVLVFALTAIWDLFFKLR